MNIHFSSATLARAIENNPAMLYFVYNKVGRHSRGQEGPGLSSPPTGRVESRAVQVLYHSVLKLAQMWCPTRPLMPCGGGDTCHSLAEQEAWLPCRTGATAAAGAAQDVVCVLVAHHFESGEFVCQLPFFPPIQEPAVRHHMTTIMYCCQSAAVH